MTKLIEFVLADDLAGVQQELTAGAEPYAQDKDGFTALQLAAMFGKTRVLRGLLEHPVDIRRSTANGWNPLPLALRYSHFDAASILLDAGAQDADCEEIAAYLTNRRAIQSKDRSYRIVACRFSRGHFLYSLNVRLQARAALRAVVSWRRVNNAF